MDSRSARIADKNFPYLSKTICYIEVYKDGTVRQGDGREVYERAKAGESTLYAVWPGQWRSDLFIIDPDEYARALGMVHDTERTGLQEHPHQVCWEISPYEDNPSGVYADIDLQLECGCTIRDIDVFAKHMRQQLGWDVARTVGWGRRYAPGQEQSAKYSIRVRRSSLML